MLQGLSHAHNDGSLWQQQDAIAGNPSHSALSLLVSTGSGNWILALIGACACTLAHLIVLTTHA